MDFPGNSHIQKQAAQTNTNPEKPAKPEGTSQPKEVKKVVTGKVIERPETVGSRLKNMFANGGGFGKYLVDHVIVPMAKDMVLSIITQTADGVRQGIEEKLFGEDTGNRRTRTTSYGTGRPVVNYNKISTVRQTTRVGGEVIPLRRVPRIKDIVLETREEADAVIEGLDELIENFNHCTVGDLYSLVGLPQRSVDEELGWDDLRQARVRRLGPNEFQVVLPRPIAIDAV